MKRVAQSLLLFTAAAFLAGCAGAPRRTVTDETGQEHEWVRPTGSNIAVRVPKGQKATVGASPTGTMTGDQMQTMVNSAGGKVPTDTGSR